MGEDALLNGAEGGHNKVVPHRTGNYSSPDPDSDNPFQPRVWFHFGRRHKRWTQIFLAYGGLEPTANGRGESFGSTQLADKGSVLAYLNPQNAEFCCHRFGRLVDCSEPYFNETEMMDGIIYVISVELQKKV